MKLFHLLAHALGLEYGTVVTWWQGDDLMVGFKCGTCGHLSGVEKTIIRRPTARRAMEDE